MTDYERVQTAIKALTDYEATYVGEADWQYHEMAADQLVGMMTVVTKLLIWLDDNYPGGPP